MNVARIPGLAGILAIVMTIGTPASAQQKTIGEVSASIDGEAFEWRTLGPDPSGNDYNTSVNAQFGMLDVSVMGFPPGDISMRGVVQLTFMLMPNSLETIDQEVIFAPDGMSRMWTSLEGEDLITIEHLDATAPTGEVSGRFSGRVCRKDSLFAEPDPNRCKDIDGTFTTRLPHAED